jgi:hypothetical protein
VQRVIQISGPVLHGLTVVPYLGQDDKGDLILIDYQLNGQALSGASGQGVGWVPFTVNNLSYLKPNKTRFTDRSVPNLKETIVDVICYTEEIWVTP